MVHLPYLLGTVCQLDVVSHTVACAVVETNETYGTIPVDLSRLFIECSFWSLLFLSLGSFVLYDLGSIDLLLSLLLLVSSY
jgi:hypothetical protein